MVIAILLAGLGTLFLPMFSVTPAVFGKAEWSAFDILALAQAGMLSHAHAFLDADMAGLWLTYCLLALGLPALWLRGYHKPLAIFAVIGLWASGRVIQHGHYQFGMLLGVSQQAIAYRTWIYLLPGLLAVLLYLLSGEFRRERSS